MKRSKVMYRSFVTVLGTAALAAVMAVPASAGELLKISVVPGDSVKIVRVNDDRTGFGRSGFIGSGRTGLLGLGLSIFPGESVNIIKVDDDLRGF